MTSQWNGEQEVAVACRQVPAPSQIRGEMKTAPTHMPAAHSVPVAYRRQALAPSHVPSSPQLEAGVVAQRPSGSAAPAGTGVQVPHFPERAQLAQAADLLVRAPAVVEGDDVHHDRPGAQRGALRALAGHLQPQPRDHHL